MIGAGIAMLGSAIGIGFIGGNTACAIARNPEASDVIWSKALVAMALAEVPALVGSVAMFVKLFS